MKKTVIVIGIITIILIWIYLFKWAATPIGIQQWDQVILSYKASLPDWRIFSNSEQEIIVVGENSLPWVDNKLVGQQSWDSITVIITAAEGYGMYYDQNKIQRMPIYTLTQAGITPEQWKFVLLGWTRYYIKNLENDVVTLDTNPEHTRQDLKYSIQILWRDKK